MRDIKFRGMNANGFWNYGLLIQDKSKDPHYEWFISNSVGKPYAYGVIEKTIGQYSGKIDKYKSEIYEGDVMNSLFNSIGNKIKKPVLVYQEFEWILKEKNPEEKPNNFEYLKFYNPMDLEIIGNIHETLPIIDDSITKLKECKFDEAWIGQCKAYCDENGFCEKHKNIKCSVCGGYAVRQCEMTLTQFVCGAPLCKMCNHKH